MTIRILEGLLPIISKKDGAYPVEEKPKEKIQTELNKQAERERLAAKTINNDPNNLQFETIDHSLFRIFDREDHTPLAIEDNSDILTLMPVGSLSLSNFQEHEPAPPVTTLNTKDYVEERKSSEIQVVVSSLPEYTAMDEADEEHFSSSQYARDVLEDVLRPEQPDEQPVQTPSRQIAEELDEHLSVQTEDGIQITIDSSDSEMEDMEPTTVPAEPAATESAATPALHETMSNVSDESTSSPPTIITPTAVKRTAGPISLPSVTTLPATTETETETIPEIEEAVEIVEPTEIAATAETEAVAPTETTAGTTIAEDYTTSVDHWYSDDMITTNAPVNQVRKIFAYKPQMIPVFPTETQQKLCDKVTESCKLTKNNAMFNVNIEKMIDILNFPSSSSDSMSDEQWDQSGKTMFIKNLLQSLVGMDLIVLLVGRDLTEEEALLNLVASTLQLDCVRLNYLLDDGWNGEYGVIVKTMGKVNQNKGTAERGSKFSCLADLIICMDIRISKDNSLFEKIKKRGTTDTSASVSWLTSVGSVEERTFNFLAEHNLTYSGRKSDDLKEVMAQDNDWQHDSTLSVEKMNNTVVDNVKYWLKDIVSRKQYQYRSTIHLPKSYLYAYLRPMPVVTEENTSDMDIGSDYEDTQITERPLSEAAISYVDNVIIPTFDINSGTLVQTDPSQIYSVLTDQEKHLFDSLPKDLYTDYRNEATNLKRQYETAFQTLHDKYREKAISKIENTRRKNV